MPLRAAQSAAVSVETRHGAGREPRAVRRGAVGAAGILPVLYVPVLASAGCLAQSAEGYFIEGMARQKGGALCVTYTRFFTRHEVCVMTPT